MKTSVLLVIVSLMAMQGDAGGGGTPPLPMPQRFPVTETREGSGAAFVPTGAGAFEIEAPRPKGGAVLKAAAFGFSETNDYNGAALVRALAAAKACGARALELAPGTYNFFDDDGVELKGFSDFTLDGKGALLVFRRPSERGPGANLRIVGNERCVVRNFKMDWDWANDPLASLGTCVNKFVDEKNDDASYIDMKLDRTPPCYPKTPTLQTMTTIDRERRHLIGTPPNRLVFLGNAKGPKSEWIARDVLRIWPGVKPAPDAFVTPHYVCYYNPRQNRDTVRRIPVGISYRLLHYYYGKGAIALHGNRHLTLADVDIWSCRGFGLGVGGEQHHWQVVNVRLAPPARLLAERMTSSTADGHHVSRSLGWCKYIGFEISFCNDDSHNFHDCTAYGVAEAPDRLRVTFSGGNRSLGARPGDTIELRENNFDPTGWRGKVLKVAGNTLTMERPVPQPKGDRFLFFNRSMATDHILMRRCVCRDSHFRNLFQSNDITLEDCTFERMGSAAVQLTGSWLENLWCEGMGVTNVVVRNCLFKNGNQQTRGRDKGWAAEIYSCLEMPRNPTIRKSQPGFFAGILFEKNRFENCAGLVANLIHVNDFTFRDNLVVDDGTLQPRSDMMGGFNFRNCCGITVENNRWLLAPGLATSALSCDADCSGLRCRGNRREALATEPPVPAAEARFIGAGARVLRTRPLAGVRRADGAIAYTVPREEATREVADVEIRLDVARARKGDPGYALVNRGQVIDFSRDELNWVQHRGWIHLPYYAMKTEKGTFIAMLEGMRFEHDLVLEAHKGQYAMFPRWRIAEIGAAPYEDMTVVLYPLPQGSDYNLMAKTYRRYRFAQDPTIRPLKVRIAERPHLAKLANAVALRQTHAGKPWHLPESDRDFTAADEPPVKTYCTYAKTLALLKKLKAAGVDDVALCVAGWQNGGYDGRCPTAFPVEKGPGGEEGLRMLCEEGRRLGYIIDGHSNYTDCFTCSPHWNGGAIACKKPDGSLYTNGAWSGGKAHNLCLKNVWATFLPGDLERIAKLGFRGCHYIDVFTAVQPYRCNDPAHPATTKEQAEIQRQIVRRCHELFGGFASECAMDHLIGSVDYINYVCAPMRGKRQAEAKGRKSVYARFVPFFELAFHDVVLSNPDKITQGTLSSEDNLTLVEYGGRPIFYGVSEGNLPAIVKAYEQFKTLRHLQVEEMLEHKILAEGFVRVTYANGDRVYVNHANIAQKADGVEIAPVSFRLVRQVR